MAALQNRRTAPCDAARPEDVEALVAQANELHGPLDALYHVAGISGRRHGDGPLLALDHTAPIFG